MRERDDQASLTADQAAAADAGAKGMIPIGRPFLDYVLSALGDAGLTDVCLVVSPHNTAIQEYYTRQVRLTRLRVSFAVQERPVGTANAVLASSAFVGSDPFLVMNSDNYYPTDVLRTLREQNEPSLPAFEREALISRSNIPPDRIARFALLDIGPDGYLRRIVEKPEPTVAAALGPHAAVSMNCWHLTPQIFEACRRVPPSDKGEVVLADAVQWAIDHLQMRIRALPTTAGVLDLSRRGDVPAVAAALAGTVVEL